MLILKEGIDRHLLGPEGGCESLNCSDAIFFRDIQHAATEDSNQQQ